MHVRIPKNLHDYTFMGTTGEWEVLSHDYSHDHILIDPKTDRCIQTVDDLDRFEVTNDGRLRDMMTNDVYEVNWTISPLDEPELASNIVLWNQMAQMAVQPATVGTCDCPKNVVCDVCIPF